MLQDIKARAQALWEQGTEPLTLSFLAIVISPRLFVLILLFGIGLIVGFAYGVPNASQAKTAGGLDAAGTTGMEKIDHIQEMMGPKTQLAEFVPISPASDHPSHLAIPPEIDGELTKFLDFFIRDFINGWFDPLNHSKSSEFPSAVHAALRHSFITLGFAAARMNVVTAVVPISQSLVHHIREYRQYEQSSLDLPAYLAPTQQHLRRLSAHIALSILPRSDKGSPVVFSFVRELLATTVLNSLVESISDPDVINRAIVERCKTMLADQANALVGLNGESGGSVHGSAESVASSTMTRSRKSSENPYADQLYLKIVEGKRLPAGGTSFYCAIICGDDLLRTRKVMAEANPIWMEDFQFMWETDAAQPVENIVIDLYDTRTFRDELVGTVTIPTANFQANKYTKAWHPLITSDARTGEVTPQASEILVEVMMISTNVPEEFDDEHHPRSLPTSPGLTVDSLKNSVHPTLFARLSHLSPDFQPTDLTLLDYMEDLGASAYVQLYLMIETFRNSHSEIDGSVQDEAQMLFETFFTAGARFAISFDDVDPSLVAEAGKAVYAETCGKELSNRSVFNRNVRGDEKSVSLECDGSGESGFVWKCGENVTEVSPVKTEEVGSSSPQRGPPPKPPRASAPSSSAIMNVVPVKQDEHMTAIRSTMSSTPPPPPLPSRPVAPSLPPRPSPTPPLNLMDADTDDISSMIMSSLEMENSGGSPVNASTKPPSLPYRPSDDAVEEAARRAAMEEETKKTHLQIVARHVLGLSLRRRLSTFDSKRLCLRGALQGERRRPRWVATRLPEGVSQIVQMVAFNSDGPCNLWTIRRKKGTTNAESQMFAAVSTGNVVGSVGGAALNTGMSGINTIRRGITKKLEQRRASTSPQRVPPPPILSVQVIGAESMDRGRSAVPRVPPPPADSHIEPPIYVKSDDKKPPLSPQEMKLFSNVSFGTIEEIFRLSDPNQWIRQKGLHMVKSVLRRTHGTYIAEMIQQRLEDAKSTPAVAGYLKSTTGALWPEGVFHSHAKAKAEASQNDSLSESQSNDVPPPKLPRTEEEKSDTRIEAKHLLLRCSGLLGLDALENGCGEIQYSGGDHEHLQMLQHRELNRGLICAVLKPLSKAC
ncbi:hypothetical protein BC829DRAFT_403549 [Chytridium lagenaria]|nr:hypothetical protein BC829DRAFT_403549 [Chytridium lagenaria]